MSWLQNMTSFAKRLLSLENKTQANADEIEDLRKDLTALKSFTQKVAYAVKRNEDRHQDRHEHLVLSLKVELLELESRLANSSSNKPHAQSLQSVEDKLTEYISSISELYSSGKINKDTYDTLSKQILAGYFAEAIKHDFDELLNSQQVIRALEKTSES